MPRADRARRAAGAYALVTTLLGIVLAGGLLLGGFRAVERSDYMTYQLAARLVAGARGACLYEARCQAMAQDALIGDEPTFERGTLPYTSPPTLATLVAPLAALPLHLAFAIFTLLGLAVLGAAAWSLAWGGPATRLVVTMLVVAAWPTVMGAVRGQLTLAVAGLLGLSVAWLAVRPTQAGALAGLATLKPTLVPLWLAWLLLARQGRALVAAGIVALLLLAVAGLVVGPDALLAYPAYLFGVAGPDALGVHPEQMVNFRGAAARLALPPLETIGVATTLALVGLGWWGSRSSPHANTLAAGTAFIATPLVVPHANQHEAILASLGVVALLAAVEVHRRRLAIGAVATHVLLWSGPLVAAEASAWLLMAAQVGWLLVAVGLSWQGQRYHRSVPVLSGTG